MPTSGEEGSRYHHGNLRAALLEQAETLLVEAGPAALSLREVARRAGVSHNAPYRHFPTREALLAALSAEGFRALGAAMAAAGAGGLAAMGGAYVGFAMVRPALYRLMFSGLVDKSAFPALHTAARGSYAGLEAACGGDPWRAIRAWSLVHGLAMLLLDGQISAERLAERPLAETVARVLEAG